MRFVLRVAASILTLCVSALAWGQSFPNKPIRMVMPWNPGGTTDTTARILGQKMTET